MLRPLMRYAIVVFAGSMLSLTAAHRFEPAVTVSASSQKPAYLDDVTFSARIRPDLAVEMRTVKFRGYPYEFTPHIIGWHWIADLDRIDTLTKACQTDALTCKTTVYGSGTMVFSIRTSNSVCAGWVHVDMVDLPDINEADPKPRERAESTVISMKTKIPTWPPCTN